MSIAVSSTSLREKGDMLLSGVTDDQEKEPRGVEGKTSFVRPGRLSPLVSAGAEWLRMPSRPERLGDVPPTVSNLLLSNTIMVTPWPRASYLEMING